MSDLMYTDNRLHNISKSPSADQMSSEEQPLLGTNSSPQLRRCSNDIHNKTPVLHRKGMSTPCTPESQRRKNEAHTWTEKISMSLENLKKAFRKAGSEERDKSRIGDGSQLADSFENLSICNPNDFMDSVKAADYENVKLVAAQLNKPIGRTKPMLKNPGNPLPTRCSQIREVWTPPCSPDYRDHTTPNLEPITVGYQQFNNSNSNQVAMVKPTEYRVIPTTHDCLQRQVTNNTPMTFDFNVQTETIPNQKSPVAAPRQSKDTQNMPCSVYENVEVIAGRCLPTGLTPSSRCSGYSSGSRGSSENDLVCAQLETIKSIDMIPEDMTVLSVAALTDCLLLYELPNVANKFKQHQIDGQFFRMMNDQMFRDDNFSFSDFEILKLKRLRDGWRPRF